MTVIFRPQAVEDVVEAVSWYEAQVPGLGEQLIDEILRATRRAQENPELFRIVHRDGERSTRAYKSFPYRIFFSAVGETLYIHAVLHGARHDRRWTGRL